jgi:hypothetical protein
MRLLDNPQLLDRAKEEFLEKTAGGYVCPIPAEIFPDIPTETL